MIKYIAGLITLLIFLASCGEDEAQLTIDENGVQNNFMISGKVEGADNTTFYLEALSQQGNISVAQAKSDADGKFTMQGNIPGFGMFQLRMGEATDKIIPLTIVPDDKVTITSTFADYNVTPIVTGTNWASVMTDYMAKFSQFHNDQQELMSLKGKVTDEELTERFVAMKKVVDDFSLNSMEEDPSNPFNIILSSSATPAMGFAQWDSGNLKILKKVAEAYTTTYKNSPIAETLSNQVYQIEVAYNNHIANNSGDRIAPEIALKKPDGSEIRLSSLKGKYVLIDFWASWCGPCRKESPNMVRIYNQYKDQDFTIFSVSLDKNADAWKNAIAQDGLIWPHHGSDLLQWDTPLISLYNFNSIPHTVLVDKAGKIVASGLRGEKLEQKLKEILKK
ncbi:MAG: AhpC/TSA family protein [Crocinitomicaceae bacterium]|nr:AhpC/TSA family protein [Crocinitomicaceae bacterium]